MKTEALFKNIDEISIEEYLIRCGVDNPEEYLKAKTLENPSNYKDIEKAKDIILKHVKNKKKEGGQNFN